MASAEAQKNRKRKKSTGVTQVTVTVAESNPANAPVLVSFPSGLPESVANPASTAARPKCQWKKLSAKSSLGRKVVGQDSNCVYLADCQGRAFDDRRTKVCVAAYDKTTGTLTLREANSRGTVFAMQQAVPDYIEKHGEVATRQKGVLSYDMDLYHDFGSAKKRKVLKSQAANQVDIDHVIGAGAGSAVLEQVSTGASMSESNRRAIEATKAATKNATSAVEAAYTAARKNFLPEYNEDAVKPDKVYNAQSIAGDTAWSRVNRKVKACLHSDDPVSEITKSIFDKDWHPSALRIVTDINPNSSTAEQRLSCAVLVNWFIRFYVRNHAKRSIPAPDETKAKYFGMPSDVAVRCANLFTTSFTTAAGKDMAAMSKANKDRCVVHILLLYMMAQPTMKISDLRPIAEDLKLAVNDCAQILRQAGCTITKKGIALSATLKTPLTFPPPKKAGRSKGKR